MNTTPTTLQDISTLLEMLDFRLATTPDQVAFTFDDQPWTFTELWHAVDRSARSFFGQGLRYGSRAVIAVPNSHAFFPAFYGVQRCGGIAVPIVPNVSPKRMIHMANLCDARMIVVPDNVAPNVLSTLHDLAAPNAIIVTTVSPETEPRVNIKFPPIASTDIAFLQYTSGSTGDPKGVQLSHGNLITNAWQLIDGMEITENEIFVSWLPLYHDMGLILKTIVPFLLGAQTVLLPTTLSDVSRWLSTIHQYRGTFTAAPDFAYRLCMRYIKNPTVFDLSSLRVALNAAEPVRLQTINDFEAAFGLQNIMTAGYGLAEATVGVSMSKPQQPIRNDDRGLVSVGKPFIDVDIAIVDDDGNLQPTDTIGEIIIRSTANCQGYYDNPQATAKLFRDDGYFYSGDLGYLDDNGYLYIVGRKKNTIIQMGQTLAPQEIEEIVDEHPAVRFSAAIGVDRGRLEGEQVYVFAEIRNGDNASATEYNSIVIDIVGQLHNLMGSRPARVYLLKPNSIPRTHNGKLQHVKLRQLFIDGTLQAQDKIYFPRPNAK